MVYDNYSIKYVKWNGSSWEIETVDNKGYVGGHTSIELDDNNFPHITYVDLNTPNNYKLKYAKWNGINWSIETVDNMGDVGLYNSLELDSNDNAHICYLGNTGIRYAKWTGSNWDIEMTIDEYSQYPSLVLDSNDFPHISYCKSNTLKYAKCSGRGWENYTISKSVLVGRYPSLMLDDMDLPHISYKDYSQNDLKYATLSNEGQMQFNYSWDFDANVDSDGDGDFTNDVDATGPTPTHIYGDDGIYTVTLTVIDDHGLSDTDTCNVTVQNVDPTVTIESVSMEVEIGLRVAGRKYNDVGLTLYENDVPIGYVSIERIPGSPDDQMVWIPLSVDFSKSYSAIVTYTPEDPPNIGANPVWIYIKSQNGSIKKIHHTFNVQQSKKRDSEHWNHVEPWEVDLGGHFVGLPLEVVSHITDPGSDDEILTYTYGSQSVTVTHLNNPPNPDLYPSPEVNPVDLMETITLVYEGPGTVTLVVRDDDNIRLGVGEGTDSISVG
jgi:PKD repeat protein